MSRYNTDEQAMIDRVEVRMKEMMANYDPSHDAYHVQRVRKTALSIANSLHADPTVSVKPDLLVVELAALAHDMLDKKYVSAEEAANPDAFFTPLFAPSSSSSSLNLVSDGRALLISKIVDNVSWSTEKKRRANGEWGEWHDSCVELHCVQDADRLDAIGAFGVMRCAAFSAATNRALHVPSDDPSLADSTIQHFHDKLLHIRERLKTDVGKQMGEKRHIFMLEFLRAVDDEYAS